MNFDKCYRKRKYGSSPRANVLLFICGSFLQPAKVEIAGRRGSLVGRQVIVRAISGLGARIAPTSNLRVPVGEIQSSRSVVIDGRPVNDPQQIQLVGVT